MRIQRGSLYLADLDPRRGSEPGKVRPVLVIQTDLLRALPRSILREVEDKLRRLGDL